MILDFMPAVIATLGLAGTALRRTAPATASAHVPEHTTQVLVPDYGLGQTMGTVRRDKNESGGIFVVASGRVWMCPRIVALPEQL
jgi:hypothetical protein